MSRYSDLYPAERPILRRTVGRFTRSAATVSGLLTTLTGRAVPYRAPQVIVTDVFSEEFLPGCFRDSLATTPAIPLLWTHDRAAAPIGVAEHWDDQPDGLAGRWRLDTRPAAQEIGRLVADGFVAGLSVGFQYDTDGVRWTTRNGLDHAQILRARLVEVSIVSTPAYPGATITNIRKSRRPGHPATS